MGALNIPSAADIERLTRRLRSVSHRLEGIEDGVHRLDRALSPERRSRRACRRSRSSWGRSRASSTRRRAQTAARPRRPPAGSRRRRQRAKAAGAKPKPRRGKAAEAPKRREAQRSGLSACSARRGAAPQPPRAPIALGGLRSSELVVDARARAARVERVGDGEHAGDRARPRPAPTANSVGGLHLDRERIVGAALLAGRRRRRGRRSRSCPRARAGAWRDQRAR